MLDAIVRLFQRRSGGSIDLSMTEWEAVRVTQHEQEGLEECRAGFRYSFAPKNGITGIAPVQAIPTTAAQWVLFNKDGAKSVIIDELGMFLVSGTAGAGIVVLCTPFSTPDQSAVSMNANMGVWSNNCGGSSGNGGQLATSALIIASGVTITQPAAPYWRPIAEALTAATAIASTRAGNPGVKGRLILPPRTGLALAVCSPAGTTPLYAPYGEHVEKVITNEG